MSRRMSAQRTPSHANRAPTQAPQWGAKGRRRVAPGQPGSSVAGGQTETQAGKLVRLSGTGESTEQDAPAGGSRKRHWQILREIQDDDAAVRLVFFRLGRAAGRIAIERQLEARLVRLPLAPLALLFLA